MIQQCKEQWAVTASSCSTGQAAHAQNSRLAKERNRAPAPLVTARLSGGRARGGLSEHRGPTAAYQSAAPLPHLLPPSFQYLLNVLRPQPMSQHQRTLRSAECESTACGV